MEKNNNITLLLNYYKSTLIRNAQGGPLISVCVKIFFLYLLRMHFMLFCVLAVHTIKDRCQWLSIQHSVNITSVCIYAVMFQICL